MRLAIASLILFSTLPALAQIVFLPTEPKATEDSAAKVPAPTVRATQINHCPDGKGGVQLQDLPCTPASAPASKTSAANEVVELGALEPRPPADPVRATRQDPETRSVTKGLIDGAWKLGLLLLACYLLVRLVRAGRDQWRARVAAGPAPIVGPRRVR